MLNLLPSLIIFILWGGSVAVSALPFFLLEGYPLSIRMLGLSITPILFIFLFSTFAGILSRAGKKGMIVGKFPRDPMNPVYFLRRIYNGCWTQLFYFKPVYSAVLAVPWLRTWVFRLFGYRGSMKFVIYPDTWLRDLPVSDFGAGVYISNRSTLGSNICLTDGTILVQGITLGENALVGHLGVMGPGCVLSKNSELGVGATFGMRVKTGEACKIHPGGGVNHGAKLGANVKVGTRSHVGLKVVIADNINIPPGCFIPDGSTINSQEEIDAIVFQETKSLKNATLTLTSALKKSIDVS